MENDRCGDIPMVMQWLEMVAVDKAMGAFVPCVMQLLQLPVLQKFLKASAGM